ncbi:retron Eco8 family effector endonuclease [Shewanella algae]|uniref:retron Eco8 family effector endonuclease n=1 Tax=Shewanella algae TaxID=38313 RepID=UPI0031F5C125
MAVKSISIENVLSFRSISINDISEINCIVGMNNAGKTNLAKALTFFYDKLSNKRVIPPELNSGYSKVGSISITYDLRRLRSVVSSNISKKNGTYHNHISNELFNDNRNDKKTYKYTLTIYIHKDGSVKWSDSKRSIHEILYRIHPFFILDMRRLDLHDWTNIWKNISKLKFLNLSEIDKDKHVEYIKDKVSPKSNSYLDFVSNMKSSIATTDYKYEEEILNYIKVGLNGDAFNINGQSLDSQSDGTNSYQYLELFISLLITLSRREFIEPLVYVDEPELGIHCKKNELFVLKISQLFEKYKKTKPVIEKGKYATPMPRIFLSTHSPNITKQIIKLFNKPGEHQILHLSKDYRDNTKISKICTQNQDRRFYNIFSDNEARLLFSEYILFVEGETELELFGNIRLISKFPHLYNIDICKANEVTINGVANSIGKKSIKYSILYDMDKALTIDTAKNTITFKKKEINLHNLSKQLKYSTYQSQDYRVKANADFLLNYKLPKSSINPNTIEFDKFNALSFTNIINKTIHHKLNKLVVSTTTEGLLINKESIIYFIEWIKSTIDSLEINHNFSGKNINLLIAEYNSSKNVEKTFGKLHCINGMKTVDKKTESFSIRIKRSYIRMLERKINKLKLTDNQLANVFRLVFEGKSDTLLNQKSTMLNPNIKEAIKIIKEEVLRFFPYKIGKTHGWVTAFTDFCINKIEEHEDKELSVSFEENFNFTFQELHGIISLIKVDRN